MSRLAVFVFPVGLDFYLAAKQTHKQLLTLYNPYDFAVNFNVLSTSPHKFTVIDPEGVIAPLSCIDIIVRYSQPSTSHCNGADKFRITMQDRTTNRQLGRRDIPVTFHLDEPENAASESMAANENFQPIRADSCSRQDRKVCNDPNHREARSNIIAICIGIACIVALLLPTQTEPPSNSALPLYLHLSVNLKLVLSFVLGLVSMVVLKP